MEKKVYADVWSDTVDIRHLAMGIVIGLVLSLSFYIFGLSFIQSHFRKVPLNLSKAYALLIGIFGSLVSAVISANLFKPKRSLREGQFSKEERNSVLEELQINRDQESKELNMVEPEIIEEMKQLQLYDIFAGKNQN